MYKIQLGKTGMEVPTIAVGCMRINSLAKNEIDNLIKGAMDMGANFFDHADIYAGGECERVFADALDMTPSLREKMIIQTKCGIVPGKMFDFSKEHILEAVDGSLKRLKTEYIDVLLLHRPDTLMEPEEVGEAFSILKESGKVRHFGVSNQNPMQMALLQKYIDMPLCANQLQMSIMHTPMIQAGINVNMLNDSAVNRDGGVLEYCRLHDITIKPWSPFPVGFFGGCFVDNKDYPEVNKVLEEIGNKYGVSKTTMAISWLLRHPAKLMPVTGTTNSTRLTDCLKAADVKITREEWYAIYKAAGNILP